MRDNPSPQPPPRSGEGEPELSFSPSPLRGGGWGEGFRLRCLTLAVIACLALSGCGPNTTYKYHVAVIPKGLTHEHWQSVHRGAERAARDLAEKGIAVEILWDGPRRESDAWEQIELVDQKLVMIQGLVLAPQHSKQMVPPVERAVEEDVKVVVIDSNLDKKALDKNPNLIEKYVATDNYHGGWLAGEHLLKLVTKDGHEEPNLVLLRYAPGSESTEQREQGFLDYIEAQRKKGKTIHLLSTSEYAGATVDTAETAATALLNSLQKQRIDGIFAVNESSTTGLLNIMRARELNGKIRLMGFDSSRPLLRALKEGDVDGLVIQDPYRMGYLGVWIVVHSLAGYDVSSGGKTLSTGEYLVTRDNVDSEEIRNKFDPDYQQKRTIKVENYRKK